MKKITEKQRAAVGFIYDNPGANMTHPDCPTPRKDHDRHYLGKDDRGVPQRCEGFEWDGALESDWWRETGWTGR